MAVMMAKLYEALRVAGAPEDKAIAAAEEAAASGTRLDSIDNRLALLDGKFIALDSKVTVLVWAVGINAAATIAMLVRHW